MNGYVVFEVMGSKQRKLRGRDYGRVISYRLVVEGCSRIVTFQQVPESREGGSRQIPGEGHCRQREQRAQRL